MEGGNNLWEAVIIIPLLIIFLSVHKICIEKCSKVNPSLHFRADATNFTHLSMNRRQSIDLHWNFFTRKKFMRPNTGHIKSMTGFKKCHGGDRCLCNETSHVLF